MKNNKINCKVLKTGLCKFCECMYGISSAQSFCMANDVFIYLKEDNRDILITLQNIYNSTYKRFLEPVLTTYFPQHLKTYQTFILLK